MLPKKNEKNEKKYECIFCDYTCCYLSDWSRHLLTSKHKRLSNATKKNEKNEPSECSYNCDCGNIYKHKSSYYKHKKKCEITNTDISDKNLLITLIQQNNNLQKQMLEVIKNGTNNSNSNNTNINNSHNKTFNLQFFLNEECKNAMNIGEFVSSIKMDLDDLEKTGLLGYSEGISNIINKNLKCLDQTMRPIHCSDAKREVFYVKNDDQWVKENDSKPVLTKAIKQVAHENIKQISEWKKKYPDCCDPDSTKNDIYLNIVSNAMSGGTNEEQLKNYEKIISNVAKEVIIAK